jgi:peptide/nickel transport system permease protein
MDRDQHPEITYETKGRSELAMTLRRFARNPLGMTGLVIMLVMLTLHLGAPLFASADPGEMNPRALTQPPSAEHPFGTDKFGRDLFSRVLYGGRISLLIAAAVTGVTAFLGLILGALTGFFPRIDGPIMRVMDLLMAFPELLIAIGVVAVLGPSVTNVAIALVFPITPRTTRMIRSVVLSLKELDFVVAARSIGASDGRIVLRHLVPHGMPTLLVRQTYVFGIVILAEGGLSFLGIGAPPETPSLGMIVAEGASYLRTVPTYAASAGLFIVMIVLGINLLGDGLRDVLDPRMRV